MKLIIGLGTGRCGTVSLSKFFGAQRGFFAIHEGVFSFLPHDQILLPWEVDDQKYQEWKDRLIGRSNDAEYISDAASYLLPYTDKIIRDFPEVKFICLERPKHEVVKSFSMKTLGRNHWASSLGIFEFKDNIWDAIHPKFDAQNKQEALEMYWDMYHTVTKNLQNNHPEQFKVFPHTVLNSEEGRNKILDFIGLEGDRKLDGEYKYNTNKGFLREYFKRVIWNLRQKFQIL